MCVYLSPAMQLHLSLQCSWKVKPENFYGTIKMFKWHTISPFAAAAHRYLGLFLHSCERDLFRAWVVSGGSRAQHQSTTLLRFCNIFVLLLLVFACGF